MSIPPNRSAVSSHNAASAEASRTSVGFATAPPRPSVSPLRDARPRLTPRSCSKRATAAPMPRLAPVTTAVFPSRLIASSRRSFAGSAFETRQLDEVAERIAAEETRPADDLGRVTRRGSGGLEPGPQRVEVLVDREAEVRLLRRPLVGQQEMQLEVATGAEPDKQGRI